MTTQTVYTKQRQRLHLVIYQPFKKNNLLAPLKKFFHLPQHQLIFCIEINELAIKYIHCTCFRSFPNTPVLKQYLDCSYDCRFFQDLWLGLLFGFSLLAVCGDGLHGRGSMLEDAVVTAVHRVRQSIPLTAGTDALRK